MSHRPLTSLNNTDRWTRLAARVYNTQTPTRLQRNAVKLAAYAYNWNCTADQLAEILKAGTPTKPRSSKERS